MSEECFEHVSGMLKQKKQACLQGYAHPLYRSERERERLNFYACKGVHALFTSQRERERERKRRERERCRIWLFLKGMTGALAPFSYLVNNN
jgi:hypothetical protein